MGQAKWRIFVNGVFLLGALTLLWGCASELGQLGGVATDAEGTLLTHVKIQLGRQTTMTNAQGQYLFMEVPPGTYRLNASAKGFDPQETTMTVRPGFQRFDVLLRPAREETSKQDSLRETVVQAQPQPETLPQEPIANGKSLTLPNFKMPLPGEFDWLLSTEPGGKFYGGGPNLGHRGRAYFSLDLIDNNRQRGELDGFPVPVLAAAAGVVIEARNNVICQGCQFGYGNYVRLDHGAGFTTIYGHLRYPSVTVRVGERVWQGQVLGFMGSTGHSTGIHLHFEIRYLNEGSKQAMILNQVLLEGVLLSAYKVGTVNRPKYYSSSQVLP